MSGAQTCCDCVIFRYEEEQEKTVKYIISVTCKEENVQAGHHKKK